jgi:hypothetical protein
MLNQNEIFQYDLHSKKLYRHTAQPSFNYTPADVNDPFKIIVLEANFNQLYLFDNQLNPYGKILNAQSKLQPYPILFARNNRAFYIFFNENKVLQEYSLNFSLRNEYYLHELQNDDIEQFITNESLLIFAGHNSIYMLNYEFLIQEKISELPTGRKHFYKYTLSIFNEKENHIHLLNIKNKQSRTILLPDSLKITDALWYEDFIYFISPDALYKSEERIPAETE